MRLTFHGGVLLAAISAAAEATTLAEKRQEFELAQTNLNSELEVELMSFKDEKEKKEKKK